MQMKFEYNNFGMEGSNVKLKRIPIYKCVLEKSDNYYAFNNYISGPNDVYDLCKSYLENEDREHFVIIMLNVKHKVIGINTVSIGVLSSCPVHPREVFKPAIVSNSHGIIAVHNHPSGDPYPSDDDIRITRRLKEAGEILGIALVDHIIIGDHRYMSLKEMGYI